MQNFKVKIHCLYFLPKTYDTSTHGQTNTECFNFCVNAGNEKERKVRVCQHRLLMATSKSWQRKPFREYKLLKKAGCLKKAETDTFQI